MPDTQSMSPSDPILTTSTAYLNQADIARERRMRRNRDNIDCYHLRQDYSHKTKGQSKEFLSRQQVATDQFSSFLTQGLIDLGVWFSVEQEEGVEPDPVLTNGEIEKILRRQLKKNDFYYLLNDALQTGALQSLMIVKNIGKDTIKAHFVAEPTEEDTVLKRVENSFWDLGLMLVRPEDYYPDPEPGKPLYEIQRITMDRYQLLEMAEQDPEGWDMEAVKQTMNNEDLVQSAEKSRETNQSQHFGEGRNRVELFEGWGNIIDISTGKLIHRNVTWVFTKRHILKKPQKNPFWHGMSPFHVAPITRVAFSRWHRALMDAATFNNRALNEIYNLMFDGGMNAVFGVKEVRTDWLEDPDQISDGIDPGMTLRKNSVAPPGMNALERVDTGSLSKEGTDIFNIADREFKQSALTNDLRLGSLPERNVKATEVVASNQTLSGIFQGIAKGIEEQFLSKMLEKAWSNIAQNIKRMDFAELSALLGKQRAQELRATPEAVLYEKTAQGKKYRVFGLSQVINKIQDFRKITTLLQVASSDPNLFSILQQDVSFKRLFREVVKALDFDFDKIKADEQEKAEGQRQQALREQLDILKAGGGNPEGQPDRASQVPQAAASSEESGVQPNLRSINQGITTP